MECLAAIALCAQLQAVPLPTPRPIECEDYRRDDDRRLNDSYEHIIYFTAYKSIPPAQWQRCEVDPPWSVKNCVHLGWTRPKVCGR
jgi:hypothetical protein